MIFYMDSYHYKHKDVLMTASEVKFFKVLKQTVGDDFLVFPQIHLGVIVKPKVRWTPGWWLWRKALLYSDRFSVDYVVCDAHQIKPILAIELDDASHKRQDRVTRDEVVSKMLSEADLPLVRFTHDEAAEIQTVTDKISPLLHALQIATYQ